MEVEQLYYNVGGSPATEAFSLMVQTVVIADKSISCLHFLIESIHNNADALSDLLEAEKRFPLNDLHKVTSPDAECKDNAETDDDSDDDDVGENSDNDAEDSSGEEDDDDDDEQGDSDSDSDSNDDSDDDEDDDDEDSDDDEDDEEDDDEDEEEDNQPPYKKK